MDFPGGLHAGVYSSSDQVGAEFDVLPRILVCDSNETGGTAGKVESATFRTMTAGQAIFQDRGFISWIGPVTIRHDGTDFAILMRVPEIRRRQLS